MRCQDIMKRPVELCREHETIQAAARRMGDANVGFLPVLDKAGKLAGVLTDRDITLRVAALDRTASETRVGDVMTREIVMCRPADDLEYAEHLMAQHRKSRIVVVGDQGPVGVISVADLARIADAQALRTLRTVATREVLDARGAVPRSHDGV